MDMERFLTNAEDTYEKVSDFFGNIKEHITGMFNDPHCIKRLQTLSVVLIVMICLSPFSYSLPKGITGETMRSSNLVYGFRGDSMAITRGLKFDILGHRENYGDVHPFFWVQTEGGERGFVPQVDVVRDFIALKAIDTLGVEMFDQVAIEHNPDDDESYVVISESGARGVVPIRRMEDTFVSVLVNEKLSNYEYTAMSTYMSRGRFERRFMGKEVDYGYADYVRHYGKDSTVVRYGVKILAQWGDENGVFRPTVTFVNGVATSYRFGKSEKMNGNAKILSYIPLAPFILDHMGWMINNRYGFDYSLRATTIADMGTFRKVIFVIASIIVIAFVGSWFIWMNHLLPALIFSSLPYKTPLSVLNNRSLYSLLNLLLLVSSYVWITLMLAYGAIWWMLLPVIIYSTSRLRDKYYTKLITPPSFRCNSCKNLDTKYRKSHKFVRNYKATEYRSVMTYKKTVTGSSKSSENGVTRMFNKYKEIYDVDVYLDKYVCSICDDKERLEVEERELISRTYVGNYTTFSRGGS